MELTFEKVGNQYVAEFQAPSDFNLHIEREEIGVLEVHQRGSEEGKYDFAWSTGVSGRKVVDYDFGALVYPKYIKVVSGSEVVSASVNFNEGGGSGNGSGLKYLPKYYSIDWSVADEGWTTVLTDGNLNRIAATAKGGGVIAAYTPPFEIEAFSFLPVGFQNRNTFDVTFFETLESVIDYIKTVFGVTISMNGIKEISEEEYYSFDNNNLS